jgi:hypothetical protein
MYVKPTFRSRFSLACFCVVAGALVGAVPTVLRAQSAANAERPKSAELSVPTTKILAIGRLTEAAKPEALKSLLPREMRQTAKLYLAGKIDQWYVMPDQTGVVFIFFGNDEKEVQALLDQLPLGVAGLMKFQLIPIGPLSPLRTLLGEPPHP